MGDNSRQFPKVFEAAQKLLHDVFGMELAELMTRPEREQQQTKVGENRGDENSTGIKKKGAQMQYYTLIFSLTFGDRVWIGTEAVHSAFCSS